MTGCFRRDRTLLLDDSSSVSPPVSCRPPLLPVSRPRCLQQCRTWRRWWQPACSKRAPRFWPVVALRRPVPSPSLLACWATRRLSRCCSVLRTRPRVRQPCVWPPLLLEAPCHSARRPCVPCWPSLLPLHPCLLPARRPCVAGAVQTHLSLPWRPRSPRTRCCPSRLPVPPLRRATVHPSARGAPVPKSSPVPRLPGQALCKCFCLPWCV
jgi:hypothetical protein